MITHNKNDPKILFLDIDGTIRHGKEETGNFVNKASQVVIYPEVPSILKRYRDEDYYIFGVSNQLGLSLGFFTIEDLVENIRVTQEKSGGLIHNIYCSTEDNVFRKPKYGMLIMAIVEFKLLTYDAEMCLMVGDRNEDKICAQNFGIKFQLASEWRKNPLIPSLRIGTVN